MKKQLNNQTKNKTLELLKERFDKNKYRHKEIEWEVIYQRLEANPDKLRILYAMELSGGEPDVVDMNKCTDEIIFIDCSKESPLGRRGLCYDRKALDSRKANKPTNSAIDLAADIGITILTEEQYRHYHNTVQFDSKTSSWVFTPEDIRGLGGALFCDFRFGRVFTYHNGAESYYGARGFRGLLTL